MFGDEWVGLYYVKMFINDQQFWHAFTNTVIIGVLTLLIVFPLPILLALLLNEVRSRHFKRSIQTISYLPHFMSVVIVAGVVFQLTAVNGTVNQIITALGGQAITFMQDPGWFRPIYLSSEVWQTVGWGTILYLAALTTIDEQLYEAARIDGANRWKQTWHITLPGIRPTMIVLLILNVGTFMAVGFEKILLLSNPLIYSTADVISTYLFRVGIVSNSISYATAIGLFEAVIGVALILQRQRDLQEDRGGEPVVTTELPVSSSTGSRVKDTRGLRTFRVINAAFLIVVAALVVYPFVNIVAQAFSSEGFINSGQVNLVPRGFNLTTFQVVLGDDMFWRNYRNTVEYTVVATAIAMALTTTYAYALSKQHLKGRKFFIGVAVATMFFNGGLIPNYILISHLGMRNTLWAIVLPNAISVFNLLVMKSFFENFPSELEEAASIDGMSTYGVFFKVVLPLSKAVVATMLLFYAVSFWNGWFGAFLYMDDPDLYPVTLYLRNLMAGVTSGTSIQGGSTDDMTQISANVQSVTMLLTVLPIICLYPFIQRYFVSGVMLGAVKQ